MDRIDSDTNFVEITYKKPTVNIIKEKDINIEILDDEKSKHSNNNINSDRHIPFPQQIILENVKPFDYLEHSDNLDKIIFIFLNPKSGSEEGKIILQIAENYVTEKFEKEKNNRYSNTSKNLKNSQSSNFTNNNEIIKKIEINLDDKKDGENSIIFIVNIIDQICYEKGCELLNRYINLCVNNKIKVLVGGGDGTVLNLIENFYLKKLDINKCIFGHIPLGTGNDLSNALGFGCEIQISNEISSFRQMLKIYQSATPTTVDVWEMKLYVNKETGSILFVDKDKKTSMKCENNIQIRTFKKSFINYMSLGYDARVGFGFEKSRSGSRCTNKCIYFWEGCKKSCCRRTIPLSSFLESFQVFDENKNDEKNIANEININSDVNDSIIQYDLLKSKSVPFFKTKTSVNSPNTISHKDIVLKGEPVTLVCQNINFYMGGTKDIWKKSGTQIGIEVAKINKDNMNAEDIKLHNDGKKHTLKNIGDIMSNEQKFNDQKLEFFTYSSNIKVGLEKLSTGQADKVYHGGGQMLIKFKSTPIVVNIYFK